MKFLAGLALAIALVCVVPISATAQTTLDLVNAQRLAYGLLRQGQPAAALALIDTLQMDGRNQTAALFIARSRAERETGQVETAIASGRRAFSLAQSDAEKFAAARATAQALSSANKRTRAQFWLRRASQYAPDERAYAINRRDFGYVQSRNPFSYNINLSLAPSNNINNAPTSNKIVFGSLILTDPTLLPIEGVEFDYSGTAIYRLPATQTRQTQLEFTYSGRRVRLGSEAATINPDLENSDLASDRITLGWSGRFLTPDGSAVVDVGLDVFTDWYGGAHFQNGARSTLAYSTSTAAENRIQISGSYEVLDRIETPIRSSDTWTIGAGWSGRIADAGLLRLNLSYSNTDSQSNAISHSAYDVTARYSLPDPVFGAYLSLTAGYRDANFDEALYGPAPRRDRQITTAVTAVLADIEYFGFVPVIELGSERTKSNIARFDNRSTNVSVALRSSF